MDAKQFVNQEYKFSVGSVNIFKNSFRNTMESKLC